MKKSFSDNYGPYAVIAGASQGIGESFAREIAKRGVNVILMARRIHLLEEIAEDIRKKHAVDAIPLQMDLTSSNLLEKIEEGTKDYEINLLVYNAALSSIGSFFEQSVGKHEKIIALNCRGPALLTHYFGKQMKERKKGGIILMTSLTAFQGSPVVAHYGATKAYNLNLAEALWNELNPHGVDVMACVAGATSTPNYIESKPEKTKGISPPVMEPVEVAKEALEKLPENKPFVVVGTGNKISSFFMRHFMTRKMAIKAIGKVNRQMYGDV